MRPAFSLALLALLAALCALGCPPVRTNPDAGGPGAGGYDAGAR